MTEVFRWFEGVSLKEVGDLVKAVAVLVTALGVLWQKLRPPRQEVALELESRFRRFHEFFESGAEQLPPLLMEAAFGAALGHTRLKASEIPILIRQRNPTSFINTYLKVKDYLEPGENGKTLVLCGVAKLSWLRKSLVACAIMIYILFMLIGLSLLLYEAPKLAISQNWSQTIFAIILSSISSAIAISVLVAGSRIHWAAHLFSVQKKESS